MEGCEEGTWKGCLIQIGLLFRPTETQRAQLEVTALARLKVGDQLVSYIILQSKQRKQSFCHMFSKVTSGRSCRHRNPTALCERVELLVARQGWKNLAHPRDDLRRSEADLAAGGRGMELHALLARQLMEAARHGP